MLQPIKALTHTITSDNGKEFAYHEQVAQSLDADFYFANPYHSWERGLNEHTNGLIRQYLPKQTDFTQVKRKQIRFIQDRLNNRPRKSLGFKTPAQVFYARVSKVIAAQLGGNCIYWLNGRLMKIRGKEVYIVDQ